MVLPILRAYGVKIAARIEGGSWKEFLPPDGKYCNPTEEQKLQLADTGQTTDLIEGFFGLVDYILRSNSCNLSFVVTSGIACWLANKTGDFLKQRLTTKQLLIAVKLARAKGRYLAKKYQASDVLPD